MGLDQTIFSQEGASEESGLPGSIPTLIEALVDLIYVLGSSITHNHDVNASWCLQFDQFILGLDQTIFTQEGASE